jgi:hypothetical protein
MNTQSITLAEFVTARLDEREAAARAATPGPWAHDPSKEWFTDHDKLRAARAGVQQSGGEEFVRANSADGHVVGVAATGPSDDPQSMADADLIADHDPASVLADVDAKRRIVEQCQNTLDYEDYGYTLATETLRLLALPDAGHPDYDEAWRP